MSRIHLRPVTLLRSLATLLAVSAGAAHAQAGRVELNWLGEAPPGSLVGVTWGVPWPRATILPDQAFTLTDARGTSLPLQSWPLAYWPDGSVKWNGFATVADARSGGPLHLDPVAPGEAAPGGTIRVQRYEDRVEVETGTLRATIPLAGGSLLRSVAVGDRVVARDARLVALLQHGPDPDLASAPARERFDSRIDSVEVEQDGPVRAVVRVRGSHASLSGDRAWLPFDVRVYFASGPAPIRLVHSVIYDGDPTSDFVRALGLTVDVPMEEEVLNRHIRFGGEGDGLWAEPVQPLTGRRPLIHEERAVFPDQVAGRRVPGLDAYSTAGRDLIRQWAVWPDFRLVQASPDGFTVQKRTGSHGAWIDAAAGSRASGFAFVGDVSGGLGIGLKDFWEGYPSALEVRNADSDAAELRLWLWPPDAPAMDMRHYDTIGHGLDAAYEDWQPGFDTAHGVARTSEILIFPSPDVPDHAELVRRASLARRPPLLVAAPDYLHSTAVFGVWSLPDRSSPGRRWIEGQLDDAIALYQAEIEQRRWYGFWDFGDVMHAYDPVRHSWRYDVGGYAWANTELAPDLWLWYTFLRSGREDVFRMAESMTRHTSEVDVYHLGRFAGLGTRHNVRHWGDGAKEVRVSQAALKRIHHYLTADERTGDLMRAVRDADHALLDLDPMRLAMPVSRFPSNSPTRARVGPDWLAFVGNWMTEWERTGDTRYRDRILTGMSAIAEMPHGLFSGPGVLGYDPTTALLVNEGDPDARHTSHLVMIMGGAEIAFEVGELVVHQPWRDALLRYGELYAMRPDDPDRNASNRGIGGGSFPGWHARLTAWTAHHRNDSRLAARAWRELLDDTWGGRTRMFASRPVDGPAVVRPLREVPWASTNHTAQWSLNAIQLLELVGDHLPEEHPLWSGPE